MNEINAMFDEAETLSGRTYCESCCACLTAYLSYLCVDTNYEKVKPGLVASVLRKCKGHPHSIVDILMIPTKDIFPVNS